MFVFSQCIFSQSYYTKKNAPKQALKLFQKAQQYYHTNQFDKAILYFEKALSKEPDFIDAELQWASVCFDIKDYSCAEIHLQKVLQLDSFYNLKIFYTLALVQYHLDHFDQAHKNISYFLSADYDNIDIQNKAKSLSKNIIFADSAYQHPLQIQPIFLDALNSEYSEYMPSVSADGNTAVFTRRSIRGDEDLFISFFQDSAWTVAEPIVDLNTPFNEGSPALSQDGTKLMYTICDRKYSFGGCDLYLSEYKNDSWTEPYNMGDIINTAAYESNACFADNGNAVYFTSNRKGTLGGYDIWMSKMKPDKSWSVPKNLGDQINTAGNEVSPFVHPNNKVLYFSSDYFPGMGGRDLFYSIADESGKWQSPVNLGYPINSKGDESSFVVFPDGKKAWMASDKKYFEKMYSHLRPNLDLYELILPVELRVIPSTYVEITVSDLHTGKPVKAFVSVFNLNTNQYYFQNETNEKGKLLIALPSGADYAMHVYHKDYIFIPEQFRCSEANIKLHPFIIHKKLSRTNQFKDTAYVLKNIFFETASAVLKSQSKFELETLFKFLKEHPELRLKITGHTDNVGAENDNLALSEQRALAVINYLMRLGIQNSRLIHEGKGESEPLNDNSTEELRQENRRIEFRIIK